MYNPFLQNFSTFFKSRSALSVLILVNFAVFILLTLVKLIAYLYQSPLIIDLCGLKVFGVTYWLSVPADFSHLSERPWTFLTYMFLHEEFFHIFFNMFTLYFAGIIFTQFLNSKKLISTYFIGGIFGALFFILSFNIFPVFATTAKCAFALGASASVLAILVAIATYIPNYVLQFMFIGKVKFKYIAIFLVVIDLLSIEKSNPGGHLAHLGGAFWGFAYITLLKNKIDMYKWFNIILIFITNLFKPKPKLKVKYTTNKRPQSDDEYNKQRAEKQKKIDVILDKISKSGYESLTKEEKELLFKMSDKK